MSRIGVEEAQDQIQDYLRDNGSANISELVRELGCSRGTVYNAIRDMESNDIVLTKYAGNKRVVTLRNTFPGYLKVFLVALSITVALRYMEGFLVNSLIKINLIGEDVGVAPGEGSDMVAVDIIYPSITTIFLIFMLGFGAAIVILKYDDMQELCNIVRDKIVNFFDWVD